MHFLNLASAAFVLVNRGSTCITQSRSLVLCDATTTPAAPATADNVETIPPKYAALLDWLKSRGAAIDSRIVVKLSTRGGGYGAFVTDSVDKDDLLFTVPRKACITLDDALEDEACGSAFKRLMEKAGPGGNTVVMAGFMAKEWMKALHDFENGRDFDPNSFGPYLRTLPWERGINSQEHILFWSDQEIEMSLRDTMCYSEAKDLRDEVAFAIRVINGIVSNTVRSYRGEDTSSGFKWPWEAQPERSEILEGLPEATKGAFVGLITRSFQDGENDDEKLVPMLDMLQHSDEPNVSHAMRKADGTVEVRARRRLEAGEELLNQYRPELEETMPYHRFFTRFGFVPGIQEPIQNLLSDKSSIFFPQKAEI